MRIISLCILFVLILSNTYSQQKVFFPDRLTCEYNSKPLGIDKELPNLSWNINTEERNWNQTAYQIIVSSNAGSLAKSNGNLWNSGKVNSHENVNVKFGGRSLPSFMNCWWKVRVWNAKGEVSKWSEPAYWKMGVLNKADWKGKWIASDLVLKDYQAKLRALPDFDMESETDMWRRGDSLRKFIHPGDSAPAVYIRKEFKVSKKITRATAYVCGLGLHELYMNGDRVGDEYLNSAFTDYSKRVLYNTYDVTLYIKQENNALGVILGNGWYNPIVPHALRFYTADYIDPPKLLMQLHIEYEDGSVSVIATDNSWKYTTNGPIVYNDILSGETYDARKEMPGWSDSQYQDREWRSCKSAPAPAGILKSQRLSAIRKLETSPAIKVEKTNKGFRFDIGKEICGWVKIRLKGRKGQKITIRYLGSGGHTLGRYQTHYFILNDARPISYEPRFSYNGFRYVEVEGIDSAPPAQDVEGVLVATDLNKAGEFTCSNERF
ncbi:MAG TPA: family 78 glycoside hydrolase catalytic domain, partial [Flavitalea sp.]|nr:family 78 glycoside hydrolase catalytic domain [Flavitalea sp.]